MDVLNPQQSNLQAMKILNKNQQLKLLFLALEPQQPGRRARSSTRLATYSVETISSSTFGEIFYLRSLGTELESYIKMFDKRNNQFDPMLVPHIFGPLLVAHKLDPVLVADLYPMLVANTVDSRLVADKIDPMLVVVDPEKVAVDPMQITPDSTLGAENIPSSVSNFGVENISSSDNILGADNIRSRDNFVGFGLASKVPPFLNFQAAIFGANFDKRAGSYEASSSDPVLGTYGFVKISDDFWQAIFGNYKSLALESIFSRAALRTELLGSDTKQKCNSQFQPFLFCNHFNVYGKFLKWQKFRSFHNFSSSFVRWKIIIRVLEQSPLNYYRGQLGHRQ